MPIVSQAGVESSHSIEELTKSRIREAKKGRLTFGVILTFMYKTFWCIFKWIVLKSIFL